LHRFFIASIPKVSQCLGQIETGFEAPEVDSVNLFEIKLKGICSKCPTILPQSIARTQSRVHGIEVGVPTKPLVTGLF
jgi:hypothetical protein